MQHFKVHSLKFDHYCIFLFAFEAKINIPKGKLTQLKFSQKNIRILLKFIMLKFVQGTDITVQEPHPLILAHAH